MKKSPFNLSKSARRDPPTAFNPYAPERIDPYRKRVGEPGSEDTVDKLRPGHNPPQGGGMPGGGSPWSNNKSWPADTPLIDTFEGTPTFETGNSSNVGLATEFGVDLHDDYEGQKGDSGEAVLGRNSTVSRMMEVTDESKPHDRTPYNVNQTRASILSGLRTRLRSL